MIRRIVFLALVAVSATVAAQAPTPIVLHAERLLQVDTGNVLTPGEVLVAGEKIQAVGASVDHSSGARMIDLGDVTLLTGLIDAHVHLSLTLPILWPCRGILSTIFRT